MCWVSDGSVAVDESCHVKLNAITMRGLMPSLPRRPYSQQGRVPSSGSSSLLLCTQPLGSEDGDPANSRWFGTKFSGHATEHRTRV